MGQSSKTYVRVAGRLHGGVRVPHRDGAGAGPAVPQPARRARPLGARLRAQPPRHLRLRW